jgi:molybdopterin converting factor small subunit
LSFRIQLPTVLASVTGQATVEFEPVPQTLAEALQELLARYPALQQEMLSRDGTINRIFRFFLNGEGISPGSQGEKLLRDGDEMVILMMLAGG